MSDDEEIIYKGKNLGLYNYLTDLGYADFETFESENCNKAERFQLRNDNPVEKLKDKVNYAARKLNTLKITCHDYRNLVTILRSQLLFKEDAHKIESCLHNTHVFNQRPNYFLHTSAVLTGMLSSVIMLRSKVDLGVVQYLVPAGFTVMFSCYSAWQFLKEYDENRKDYMLMTHINELKMLCSNILKLTRFIKETEILSTSQIPVSDVGSVLYAPIFKHKLTDIGLGLNVSPQWKTLPHLRKCLSDTLEEVLNLFTISVNFLRKSLFDRELVENHLRCINRDKPSLKPCQYLEKECCPITLLVLKELTSKYLSVQSEYLKELAFIFSSMIFKDTNSGSPTQRFARDQVSQMVVNLHTKLTDISFRLMMQYKIHNIDSTFKKVSFEPSLRSHTREINELQNGVHNVFLLLYSALLRVRNLEDTLERFSEIGESSKMKDKLSLDKDLAEQFTVLKGDLISTMRCYDVLCQQATSMKEIETTEQDAENISEEIEVNIKETGIVVGTSDFTVNSPDEVFLSLSGTINNEETSISECVDDWCLERKPQIPKNLLTELSQTLKSRKTDFREREKHALKRKGLQDLDNLSPSSDEDSGESEDSISKEQYRPRSSLRNKRHAAAHDYSHSSDSDDEMDPFESGSFLTKLKMCKKYQSEPYSDSDSSVLDVQTDSKSICNSDIACKLILNTSSLANLAALKSQMWGKNKEEHYSDGSES